MDAASRERMDAVSREHMDAASREHMDAASREHMDAASCKCCLASKCSLRLASTLTLYIHGLRGYVSSPGKVRKAYAMECEFTDIMACQDTHTTACSWYCINDTLGIPILFP